MGINIIILLIKVCDLVLMLVLVNKIFKVGRVNNLKRLVFDFYMVFLKYYKIIIVVLIDFFSLV